MGPKIRIWVISEYAKYNSHKIEREGERESERKRERMLIVLSERDNRD